MAMDKTQVDLYHMGAVESKFAEIIWDREPISSGELVKLAKDRLECPCWNLRMWFCPVGGLCFNLDLYRA